MHDFNDKAGLDYGAEEPLFVLLEPLGFAKLLDGDGVDALNAVRGLELGGEEPPGALRGRL